MFEEGTDRIILCDSKEPNIAESCEVKIPLWRYKELIKKEVAFEFLVEYNIGNERYMSDIERLLLGINKHTTEREGNSTE